MNPFLMSMRAQAAGPYGMNFNNSFSFPSLTHPFGEQLLEIGTQAYAPALLPAVQAIEKLEESPNLTVEQRRELGLGEVLIGLFVGYKFYQSLRS
jgi:hypothetical protein